MARCAVSWDDASMRLLVTGIGDAFSAIHFGSSGLVEASAGLVAIDCPGRVLAMYRTASERSGLPIDVQRIDDILLTHLHGDHSNGLETFGFARRYLSDRPSRPRLHALPEVLERVWEKLAPAMDGSTKGNGSGSTLEDYFDPCPMQPGAEYEVAGMTVACRRTRHSVPTAGLLLRSDSACLGWSGDSEFEPAHIDWLSRADCIVHECGDHFKHTRWAELDTLPEQLQSKIRLIHLPDGADVPEGPMRPLIEGEVVRIGS
ncbi:MAG: MBL fold metallo-hydrolase [Phycisphaerales bacterium]|nr:MBL fold metallo-hydrolase [Phycisphaerales bacterium]